MCNTLGCSLQFSVLIALQALLWSYAKNLEQNLNAALKKSSIKLECYSSVISGILAISYQSVQILQYPTASLELFEYLSQFLQYSLVLGLIYLLPVNLGNRSDKENSVQTSYILVFLLGILFLSTPAVLISYLIVSKTILFLYSSQSQELLPSSSWTAGVISHILSHKDSRRIFLFLM